MTSRNATPLITLLNASSASVRGSNANTSSFAGTTPTARASRRSRGTRTRARRCGRARFCATAASGRTGARRRWRARTSSWQRHRERGSVRCGQGSSFTSPRSVDRVLAVGAVERVVHAAAQPSVCAAQRERRARPRGVPRGPARGHGLAGPGWSCACERPASIRHVPARRASASIPQRGQRRDLREARCADRSSPRTCAVTPTARRALDHAAAQATARRRYSRACSTLRFTEPPRGPRTDAAAPPRPCRRAS